jgi:hypothetical protein
MGGIASGDPIVGVTTGGSSLLCDVTDLRTGVRHQGSTRTDLERQSTVAGD